MAGLTVTRKNFDFQYRGGSALVLNATNAPWITKLLRIYRPSTGNALAVQSYQGSYNGATAGGAVTTLTPGYCYRVVAGVYDGSWSIPDAVLVDEIPTTAQASSGATLDYLLVGDGTDQTDALQALVNTATAAGKPAFVLGTVLIRDTRLKTSSNVKIGIEMPENGKLYGFGTSLSTLKALPTPAGVTRTETYGNLAPTTNAEFSWLVWSSGKSHIRIRGINFDGNLSNKTGASLHPYFCSFGRINNNSWWENGGVYFEGGSDNRIEECNTSQFNGHGIRWDSSPNGYGRFLTGDNCVSGGLRWSQWASSGATTCAGSIVEHFVQNDHHSDGASFNTNGVILRHGTVDGTKICPAAPGGQQIANFAGIYGQASVSNTVENVTCLNCSSYGFDFWDGQGTDRSWQLDSGVNRTGASAKGNTLINCVAKNCGNGAFRMFQSGLKLHYCQSIDNGKRAVDGYEDPYTRFPFGVVIPAGITHVEVVNFIVRSTDGKTTTGVASDNGSEMVAVTVTDSHFEVATPIGSYDSASTVARNYLNAEPANGGGGVYVPPTTGGGTGTKSTLTGQRLTSSYNRLNWTAVSGATEYNLFRGVVGGAISDNTTRSVYHGNDLVSTDDYGGGAKYWLVATTSSGDSISDPVTLPDGSGYPDITTVAPRQLDETELVLGGNAPWFNQTDASYNFSSGHARSVDADSTTFVKMNAWYGRKVAFSYMLRPDGATIQVYLGSTLVNTITNTAGSYTMTEYVYDTGAAGVQAEVSLVLRPNSSTGGKAFLLDYMRVE